MESTDLFLTSTKWYRVLVPQDPNATGKTSIDLISQYSDRDLHQGLLVCGITRTDAHIFALFPNYVSFAKFHQSLPETKRCFFEIILGDHPQKPHFDLEIEEEKVPGLTVDELAAYGDEVIRVFLETMIPIFENLYQVKINLSTDLLLFSSHGPKKRSFHVIIDNYSHPNHLEAKALYEEVKKGLPTSIQSFVDSSVYSKKQQFRIVGSQKRGSGRIKTLVPTWVYRDKEINYTYREEPRHEGHQFILLLEASLVTRISTCQSLPSLLSDEETKGSEWSRDRETDDLHDETIKVAFDLLGKRAGVSVDSPSFPYAVRGVMGTLIKLKRKFPSKCQICRRIHEHENPYMFVLSNDDGVRHVYFDCRRSHGEKLYLGVLPEELNGNYLPDSPCLQHAQDVISRLTAVSLISMKKVREIKKSLVS